MYPDLNDYEIIHLIQTENDGVAYEILLKKYEGLIMRYISLYKIPLSEKEDYLSEGRLILSKAAQIFDESCGKTFTRFFEMLLKQHFWKLLRKRPKYVLSEKLEYFTESNSYSISKKKFYEKDYENILSDLLKLLSPLEKIIYEKHYILKKTLLVIAKEEKLKLKVVYNAIYRIKSKLKSIL